MKITARAFTLNILDGISLGVVLALIPSALTSSLIKVLGQQFPQLLVLNTITGAVATLLPVVAAFCVGQKFHFTPLQSSAVGGAALMGSGIVTATSSGFVFNGTGDVVNIGVTIALASGLALLINKRFGSYTLLLAPLIILWVGGALGMLLLPEVHLLTTGLGTIINQMTAWQPLLLGPVMGAVFACMIVSPISSVGIATAIGLSGIASGSANLGITAAAVTLAVMSWKQNETGVSLAHFLGTPKIQMANMLTHPRLFVPVAVAGAVNGLVGAVLQIHGTPTSAGFGFSGLIGPIAAMASSSLLVVVVAFVVAPIVIALTCNWLFVRRAAWIKGTMLALELN